MTVAWTAVSGAVSYNLYYSAGVTVSVSSGTKITAASSPYAVTGLTNDTTYSFIVTAVNGAGESPASTVATATPLASITVPTAPTISVTAGDGEVTATWTNVSGATSYNLYYAAGSTVTVSNGTKVVNVTSPHTLTGLANGTQYAFILTAVSGAGESAASDVVTATPISANIPGAPAIAVTAGYAHIRISWAVVSGATSYNVYYAADSTVTVSTGTKISGIGTPYSLSGLLNGTQYAVLVTAVNSAGEGAASNVETATPLSSLPPAAPLILAERGIGQVTVSWQNVSGATSYNLYYTEGAMVTTSSGTCVTGATSPCVVSGLKNGTQYAFIVTSVNAGGEGAACNIAMATPKSPPAAPTLTVTAGYAHARISWADVSGATSYNLYYEEGESVTVSSGTRIQNAPSGYEVCGLTNGTTYAFIATSVNEMGEGIASETYVTTPQSWYAPATPTGLTVGNATPVSLTLSWAATPGAYRYYIYRSTSESGAFSQISICASESFTDGPLASATTFYYEVKAINSSYSFSLPSSIESGTTLEMPTGQGGYGYGIY